MRKALALVAGFCTALAAGAVQGCDTCKDPLPETVHVTAGSYGFAEAAPAGYSGYSLVVTANAQGVPTSAVESYTLNGAAYVYTYQVQNLFHITLER